MELKDAMLTCKSPVQTSLMVIYLCLGILCLLLFLSGNWKSVTWLNYIVYDIYGDVNTPTLSSDVCITSGIVESQNFVCENLLSQPSTCAVTDNYTCAYCCFEFDMQASLWNCLTPTISQSLNTLVMGCNFGLTQFVQAMFIFSALTQTAAIIPAILCFYVPYCVASLRSLLFACLGLQTASMSFSLITWSIVYDYNSEQKELIPFLPSNGLYLMIAESAISIAAFFVILSASLYHDAVAHRVDRKLNHSSAAMYMSNTDKQFLSAVFFSVFAGMSSWGSVQISLFNKGSVPTVDAAIGLCIIALLLLTSLCLALIASLAIQVKDSYVLSGIILHSISIPISISAFGIVISFGSEASFLIGFLLAQFISSIIALGLLINVRLEWTTSNPINPNPFELSKDAMNLGIAASCCVFLSGCLGNSGILFVSVDDSWGSLTQASYVDAMQFFNVMYFLTSYSSTIMALLSLQAGCGVRMSSATLSSWILSLFSVISGLIACNLYQNYNLTITGYLAAGTIMSFIAFILMLLRWTSIRYVDNPLNGNVCTIFGRRCVRGDCCRHGACSCCFSAQEFSSIISAPSSVEEIRPKRHSLPGNASSSRLSNLSIGKVKDPEIERLVKILEVERLKLQIAELKKQNQQLQIA